MTLKWNHRTKNSQYKTKSNERLLWLKNISCLLPVNVLLLVLFKSARLSSGLLVCDSPTGRVPVLAAALLSIFPKVVTTLCKLSLMPAMPFYDDVNSFSASETDVHIHVVASASKTNAGPFKPYTLCESGMLGGPYTFDRPQTHWIHGRLYHFHKVI